MQTSVNLYPAIGKPGQEVTVGTAAYTPVNYLSDGTVLAGAFAFAKESEAQVYALNPVASATGKAGDKVLGFVVAEFTSAIPMGASATMGYPQGFGVTIARRGDFYALATGAVTVGKAVLCDPTTGAITYGEPDAANDTGWRVMTAAQDAGEVIIISHRGRD